MQDIVQTISYILFRPTEFFESVKDETSYLKPMLFFSIGYIIMIIISSLFNIPLLLKTSEMDPLLIFIQIFGIFIGIGFAFAIPFISSGIAHLGLLIFGAKQGFYNTFKAISYSGVIYVSYGLITTVIGGYINIKFSSGFNDPTYFFENSTIGSLGPLFSLVILIIIITIISWIHILIVETIGVAKFQKISKTRAFFGIIIIPLIILMFIILIFGGLLLLLLSQGMPTGMLTYT